MKTYFAVFIFSISVSSSAKAQDDTLDRNNSVERFIQKLEKTCIEKDTTNLFNLLSKKIMGSGLNYGGGRLRIGASDNDHDIFKSFFNFKEGDTIFWSVMLELIETKALNIDTDTSFSLGVLENQALQKNIMQQDSSLFLAKATSGSLWVSLNEANKLYELPDLNSRIKSTVTNQVLTAYDGTKNLLSLGLFEKPLLCKDWIFVKTLNEQNEGWLHNSLVYNVSNFNSLFFSFQFQENSWKLYFYSF